MEENLVSIIVPVYNASKYIEETIKSINSQTYQKYEAIFINDCSKDDSLKIIKEHKEKNSRIKIVNCEQHGGPANARNIGIKEAKGRYLCFLDADDIWLENKIEKQINFIKTNNYAFVYCNYRYMTDDGDWLSKEVKTPKKTDYNKALINTRILPITTMIDLKQIPKKLCYMPNVMNEDIATWWKILKSGFVAYGQNEILAYHRRTKNSRSSKKYATAFYRWKLYRKSENLSFIKTSYCFIGYCINAIIKRAGIKRRKKNGWQ